MGYREYRFFCHEWGDSAMIFTSLSSYFYTLFYALTEHTSPRKQSSIAYFAIFAKDGLFWLSIVASSQFNLFRPANARYWHCDGIFVDCSCTRKLSSSDLHWWITIVNIDFPQPGIHGLSVMAMLLFLGRNIWVTYQYCSEMPPWHQCL